MPGANRIITLDIGASKLVLAEFSVEKSGALELINYGIGQLGIEPEAETDSSAYIVSAIREVMREHNIRPAPLYMTLSGHAVFPRYVKLPAVTRDKVLQIIQYEAEQNVPFPIDEVIWDYQLLGATDEGEMNVLLMTVKTEKVSELTDCVQAAGLEPEIVDVSPMALFNTVRYNYPVIEGCTMILDIGARSSNLIFLEENRIFTRSIPVAGNALTQDLTKEFSISFSEAEELKLEHAFVAFGGVYAGPEDETADRVSKIVRNMITRLHAEVNRSVNFYRSQQGGTAPSLILLTGGSSIIAHIDTFFREKLKVQVEYLNPFMKLAVNEQIDADRMSGDLHLLGEVAGLALRRVLNCPVEINLMPPELVRKKAFRKRQPFFVMAAVGLVLIMVCWWGYFARMKAIRWKRIKKVEIDIGAIDGVYGQLQSAGKKHIAAEKKAESIVNIITARTKWIEILKEVHSCMLEGMWFTSLRPVFEDDEITYIEIAGMGFSDRLTVKSDLTPIEEFRNRLRKSDFFTDETKITKELPSEDFLKEFEVLAALGKGTDKEAASGEGER